MGRRKGYARGRMCCFWWGNTGFFFLQMLNPIFILLGQAFFGILTAGIAGAGHGFMQNLFPTHVRYRGVSINFCLGRALCGSTAPMLLTYLIEVRHFNLYVPALYLMGVSLVFLIVLMTFSRKLYGKHQIHDSVASREAL